MASDLKTAPSFADFPDDILINILSFLHPMKVYSLASTCRSLSVICSRSSPSTDMWFALCDRRWGSKTQIGSWTSTPSYQFYKFLDRWDRLIGFWHHKGRAIPGTPSIIFFEWNSSCIIGSSIIPSSSSASYSIRKIPFISLSISAAGEALSYVHPDNPESDPIPVHVRFINGNRFVIEEIFENSMRAKNSSRRPVHETSTLNKRSSWDSQKFLKISSSSPTPARPLQGLWKGITQDMNLEFFLVTDTDTGFITYDTLLNPRSSRFSNFWTTDETLLKPPFSLEELAIFNTMEHVRSEGSANSNMNDENVTQILLICNNPDMLGRVWQYKDETFGFGFLESKFTVDLKLVAQDGHLLDVI